MGVKPQSSSTIYSDYDCCFSLGVRLKEGVILWDSKNWVQSALACQALKQNWAWGAIFMRYAAAAARHVTLMGFFTFLSITELKFILGLHAPFTISWAALPPQQNKAIPVHQSTDFYVLLIKTFETHPQLVGILRLLKVDVTRIIKITIKLMLFKSGSVARYKKNILLILYTVEKNFGRTTIKSWVVLLCKEWIFHFSLGCWICH